MASGGGGGGPDERSSRTATSGSAGSSERAAAADAKARVLLPRRTSLSRLSAGASSRPPPFARSAVSRAVRALPRQQTAAVLWAPDALPVDGDPSFPHFPYVATELVAADPKLPLSDPHSIVYPDDQFEIRVVGISVADMQRAAWRRRRKLVLYSCQVEEDTSTNKTRAGVPSVHSDNTNEHPVGPDRFHVIPDAKSVVLRSSSADTRSQINIRFKILEMEPSDPIVRSAVDTVGELSAELSSLNVALPYLSVISPVLSLTSNVGRTALDSFSIPQRATEIDMRFRLLPRDISAWRGLRTGDYLRFGWYFLLAEPVGAKLYASTSTANNVLLLTYSPATRRYHPLVHVTYIVVNVAPPAEQLTSSGPRITEEHLKDLRNLCENASTYGAVELQRRIVDVMKNIKAGSVEVVNPARPIATSLNAGSE